MARGTFLMQQDEGPNGQFSGLMVRDSRKLWVSWSEPLTLIGSALRSWLLDPTSITENAHKQPPASESSILVLTTIFSLLALIQCLGFNQHYFNTAPMY